MQIRCKGFCRGHEAGGVQGVRHARDEGLTGAAGIHGVDEVDHRLQVRHILLADLLPAEDRGDHLRDIGLKARRRLRVEFLIDPVVVVGDIAADQPPVRPGALDVLGIGRKIQRQPVHALEHVGADQIIEPAPVVRAEAAEGLHGHALFRKRCDSGFDCLRIARHLGGNQHVQRAVLVQHGDLVGGQQILGNR